MAPPVELAAVPVLATEPKPPELELAEVLTAVVAEPLELLAVVAAAGEEAVEAPDVEAARVAVVRPELPAVEAVAVSVPELPVVLTVPVVPLELAAMVEPLVLATEAVVVELPEQAKTAKTAPSSAILRPIMSNSRSREGLRRTSRRLQHQRRYPTQRWLVRRAFPRTLPHPGGPPPGRTSPRWGPRSRW